MSKNVKFQEVLRLFESHGWKLKKIWEPYRVFTKDGEPLPFLIPVHNQEVDIKYVEKIKEYFENRE
jgi:hypothetical protein